VSDDHRREWEDRYRRGATWGPPSPFVVAALDVIAGRGNAARTTPRRALDVACGVGRHAFALAARGYRVVAVDHARTAVAALRARAGGLAIDGVVADVTRWPLPVARFDVVIVVDFLERSLLPALRTAVAPGGVLVMETFMVGQERHGHPRNPAYLLRPGELLAACRGWTVLLAHEGEGGGRVPACRAGIAAERPLHVDSAEPFGS
jgi:SAM-dependent methyltransferase